MVRHILSFSRRTENEKRPLDILPVVKETLQLLRAAIPTSVTINRRFGSDIDWVEADPTQIHQLMMNLCANASDAMKETGGELTVGLENASVDREQAECTTDLKVGQYVKLTVADAGPGVPDDIMDRIFDPFFTTKEVGCGTGMGLERCTRRCPKSRRSGHCRPEPGRRSPVHHLPAVGRGGRRRGRETAI